MKPEIIKFEPEHLSAINWRERGNPDLIQNGLAMMRCFPYAAYSGIAGNVLLGCAGVVNCGFGVGYAWVVAAPEVELYKLWFHRNIKIYLKAIIRTYGLTRLQAEALKSSKRNREWLEVLGFKTRPYVVYEMEVNG